MITETQNTLEITEDTSELQVQVKESSLDVSETIQTLEIQQVGNELAITEANQELSITEEGSAELEITPNAMVIQRFFDGEGAVADQDTIHGDGTQFDPLRAPDLPNKLDDTYAHFKEVNGPPASDPGVGEAIYYTTTHLEGSVKVTEHKMRDSYGEDHFLFRTSEVL